MAMHRPRTLVGKISEQRMFGIGPYPVTKQQKYMMTQAVDMPAWMTVVVFTTSPMTRTRRETTSTGIVVSSRSLGIIEIFFSSFLKRWISI